MELLDRRLARQLHHDIALRGRDDEIAPDWSSTLRDDRRDARHIDPNPNCALRQDAPLEVVLAKMNGACCSGERPPVKPPTSDTSAVSRKCAGSDPSAHPQKTTTTPAPAGKSLASSSARPLIQTLLIAWEYAGPETNRSLLLGLLADTNHPTRNHRSRHAVPSGKRPITVRRTASASSRK